MGNKKRTWHFSNYSSHCDSLFSFSQTAGTSRFTDISFTLSRLFSAPNRATRRFLGADGSPGMEGTEHNALQADWWLGCEWTQHCIESTANEKRRSIHYLQYGAVTARGVNPSEKVFVPLSWKRPSGESPDGVIKDKNLHSQHSFI